MKKSPRLLGKVILVGTHADLVRGDQVDLNDCDGEDQAALLQEENDAVARQELFATLLKEVHAALPGFLAAGESAHFVDLPAVFRHQRRNRPLPTSFASLKAELWKAIMSHHDHESVFAAERLVAVAKRWLSPEIARSLPQLPGSPTPDEVLDLVNAKLDALWVSVVIPQVSNTCQSMSPHLFDSVLRLA
jgi:hypothetical protein